MSGSPPASAALTHPPLPARRGAVRSTTWWGKAWQRALGEAAYSEADLVAARTLARSGDVGAITVSPGQVVASVRAGRDADDVATVRCLLTPLDDDATNALVEAVAAEVGRIGALLSGDLPHALVEHADEAGAELLPAGHDLDCSCTCDAWLDPCRHALAVLVQTGWLIESDPLLLIHLRGLPRDELVARLHLDLRKGSAVDAADDALLEVALDAAMHALIELDGG